MNRRAFLCGVAALPFVGVTASNQIYRWAFRPDGFVIAIPADGWDWVDVTHAIPVPEHVMDCWRIGRKAFLEYKDDPDGVCDHLEYIAEGRWLLDFKKSKISRADNPLLKQTEEVT